MTRRVPVRAMAVNLGPSDVLTRLFSLTNEMLRLRTSSTLLPSPQSSASTRREEEKESKNFETNDQGELGILCLLPSRGVEWVKIDHVVASGSSPQVSPVHYQAPRRGLHPKESISYFQTERVKENRNTKPR